MVHFFVWNCSNRKSSDSFVERVLRDRAFFRVNDDRRELIKHSFFEKCKKTRVQRFFGESGGRSPLATWNALVNKVKLFVPKIFIPDQTSSWNRSIWRLQSWKLTYPAPFSISSRSKMVSGSSYDMKSRFWRQNLANYVFFQNPLSTNPTGGFLGHWTRFWYSPG